MTRGLKKCTQSESQGRATIWEQFSWRNNSTENSMGIEVILDLQGEAPLWVGSGFCSLPVALGTAQASTAPFLSFFVLWAHPLHDRLQLLPIRGLFSCLSYSEALTKDMIGSDSHRHPVWIELSQTSDFTGHRWALGKAPTMVQWTMTECWGHMYQTSRLKSWESLTLRGGAVLTQASLDLSWAKLVMSFLQWQILPITSLLTNTFPQHINIWTRELLKNRAIWIQGNFWFGG